MTLPLRFSNWWPPFSPSACTSLLLGLFCFFFLHIFNFPLHFNSSGIPGAVFQFIIAFAPPLGSFNINDSLILCNKATVMNWQIKMAAYWSGFYELPLDGWRPWESQRLKPLSVGSSGNETEVPQLCLIVFPLMHFILLDQDEGVWVKWWGWGVVNGQHYFPFLSSWQARW